MTWYFWVFGAVALANMLAVCACLVVFIIVRAREDHTLIPTLKEENRCLERELETYMEKNRRLNERLSECLKGANTFGRVHP